MEYLVNRVFTKRETEKSNWSGRIGAVEMVANVESIKVNGNKLPDASVNYLLHFSLQSLQDAYAGAADLTEATANWTKKFDALCEGTIGVRSGGGGMTDEERAELYVAEAWYATKNPKGTEKGDAFRARKDDDKTEFLVEVAAKLRESWPHFADKVAERVKHVQDMRAKRAAEKDALKAINVEIDI